MRSMTWKNLVLPNKIMSENVDSTRSKFGRSTIIKSRIVDKVMVQGSDFSLHVLSSFYFLLRGGGGITELTRRSLLPVNHRLQLGLRVHESMNERSLYSSVVADKSSFSIFGRRVRNLPGGHHSR